MGDVEVNALKKIDFEVYKGEFIIVLGPSGSGKSTLLHMMGLLDTPTKGQVFIDGVNSKTLSKDEVARIRGQKIGFVFQFFNLHSALTALENVELPGMIMEREDLSRAEELLDFVGLKNRKNHMVHQLSGGQRQRVSIARALMNEPSIVLADEPTGNLDSESGKQVVKMLRDINRKTRSTMVLITHDPMITKYADRLIKIKDGEIIRGGKKR